MVKLIDLINRGDVISITNGQLNIIPKSGKTVPDKWLQANKDCLLEQICSVTQQPIYQFTQFKVGRYSNRFDGLTMNFTDLKLHEDYYTIFNVSLNRKKKHGRLTGKLFNPPVQGALLKFWSRSNLPKPRRPSELYKKVNVMKGYLWQAEISAKNRFDSKTLSLANIAYELIIEAVNSGVSVAIAWQSSGEVVSTNGGDLLGQNKGAFISGSELPNIHIYQSVESGLTTCINNHGRTKTQILTTTDINNYDTGNQGGAIIRDSLPPSIDKDKEVRVKQKPQDQTLAEWLNDYDNI